MLIIGGIPRSGTTIFARMLGRHPDMGVFASETHALPTVAEIRKCVPEGFSAVRAEAYLFTVLKAAAIDMRAWNYAEFEGGEDGMRHPDEGDLRELASALIAANAEASDRIFIDMAGHALGSFLAGLTDKKVFGEKTPSNLLALADPATSEHLWLMTDRNPYDVITSMQARFVYDAWGATFGGAVENRIGIYRHYSRKLARCTAAAIRIQYERLVVAPVEVAEQICDAAGLEVDGDYLDAAARIRIPRGKKPSEFSEAELWKIAALLGDEMKASGYEARPARPIELVEQIVPLHGVYASEHNWRWCEPEASFVVYAKVSAKSARFQLHYPFSGILLEYAPTNVIEVSAKTGDNRRVVSRHILDRTNSSIAVDIDLSALTPQGVSNGVAAYIIDMKATVQIIPALYDIDNGDVRRLSFIWAD